MTEEELREKLNQVFDNYYTSLPIERRHLRWTDQILTLIREAGWNPPMNDLDEYQDANGETWYKGKGKLPTPHGR